MSFDNLTTYIEVDPEDKLTAISDRITATELERDQDAYLYKDKGIDFYDGDFSFEFYTFMDSSSDSSSNFFPLVLANIIGNINQIFVGDKSVAVDIQLVSGSNRIQIRELSFGSVTRSDQAFVNLDTQHWHTAERTGGIFTDKVYSDLERTVLVDTLSISLTSIEKYRYEYPANSPNIGGLIQKFNGYMGIDLVAAFQAAWARNSNQVIGVSQ